MPDLPLFPDLTEAASDLSSDASPLERPEVELRGLSVLDPGIFDLKDLNDREDSLVSDLLKEGMEERLGPMVRSLSNDVEEALAFGVDTPELLLEG
jgi:hypothetical protein